MNTISGAIDFLLTPENWTGPRGILARTWAQIWISLVAMTISAAVAIPAAVWLAHRRASPEPFGGDGQPRSGDPVVRHHRPRLPVQHPVRVRTRLLADVRRARHHRHPTDVHQRLRRRCMETRDDIVEAASGIGMTDPQVLRKVELPASLPLLITGIRIVGRDDRCDGDPRCDRRLRVPGHLHRVRAAPRRERQTGGAGRGVPRRVVGARRRCVVSTASSGHCRPWQITVSDRAKRSPPHPVCTPESRPDDHSTAFPCSPLRRSYWRCRWPRAAATTVSSEATTGTAPAAPTAGRRRAACPDGPTISIGAQDFGESTILAEIYGQALESRRVPGVAAGTRRLP